MSFTLCFSPMGKVLVLFLPSLTVCGGGVERLEHILWLAWQEVQVEAGAGVTSLGVGRCWACSGATRVVRRWVWAPTAHWWVSELHCHIVLGFSLAVLMKGTYLIFLLTVNKAKIFIVKDGNTSEALFAWQQQVGTSLPVVYQCGLSVGHSLGFCCIFFFISGCWYLFFRKCLSAFCMPGMEGNSTKKIGKGPALKDIDKKWVRCTVSSAYFRWQMLRSKHREGVREHLDRCAVENRWSRDCWFPVPMRWYQSTKGEDRRQEAREALNSQNVCTLLSTVNTWDFIFFKKF